VSDSAGISRDREFRRTVRQIVRVNHAGEYGAIRIYAAQIAIARRFQRSLLPFLTETIDHERQHLAAFRELMLPRGTRPCGAMPVWGIGGTLLGLATALLGKNAIMICTEAVERTVHAHLDKQLGYLGSRDPTLSETIREIGEQELGHLASARNNRTTSGPFVSVLDTIVAGVTYALIWCSTYGALTRMRNRLSK